MLVESTKQLILSQAAGFNFENIAGIRRERHEAVVHLHPI